MTRKIDNNGIGSLYATFEINKTGQNYDLTVDHVGYAVVLVDSNKISVGADGGQLLGRLEYVSANLASVQIGGVARLVLNTGKTAPTVGNAVVVDGAGKVYKAPVLTGYDPAGGNIARGTVLAVDNTNHTCDVLL